MIETQTKNQNIFWLWSNKVDWAKRGDVSYWLPQYEEVAEILNKTNSRPLVDLAEIITKGETPRTKGDVYVETGVPFIRVTNISEEGIKTDDLVKISQYTHSRLKRSIIKPNDIVFSMAGTIGVATVIPDEINEANINQAVTKIRLKKEINPVYVSTFLNSKYGRLQSLRFAGGGVQKNIDFHEIKRIRIFLPTPQEQRRVEQIVKDALRLKKEAEADYQKSQQLLNEALGLTGIEQKHELTFWRWNNEINFIEKLHPAAHKTHKITKVKDFIKIGDYAEDLSYGTSEDLTYQNSGTSFLRITDIDEYFQIDKANIKYISQFDAEKLTKYKTLLNDVLISRTGTLGSAILIDETLKDSIFGSYFIKVRFEQKIKEKLDLEYLTFFINSEAGKEQTISLSSGGVQTNLTISAIEGMEIPLISKSTQDEIVKHLQSFRTKRQLSKQKLQEAKDFVENLLVAQK